MQPVYPAYYAPLGSGVSDQPLRHSLINFLRSSPLSFLSPASLLHDFILLCCAFCLSDAPASSPFRQELMNFLRSSPFLSVALSLQFFMRSCCAFCFSVGSFFIFSVAGAAFLSSVLALSCAYASGDSTNMKQITEISFFMAYSPLVGWPVGC